MTTLITAAKETIGVVDVSEFLLLLHVRVILALLLTEINFSDRNLSKYDGMPIELHTTIIIRQTHKKL